MVLSLIQQVEPSFITPAGVAAIATAFVTIAAALLYILGLLALLVPIRRHTGDFSTALYATSLIPKTVVAGQGIRLFAYPLFVSTSMIVVLITAMSIFSLAQSIIIFLADRLMPAERWGWLVNWAVAMLLMFICLVVVVILIRRSASFVERLLKNRYPKIATTVGKIGKPVFSDVISVMGGPFAPGKSMAHRVQTGVAYTTGLIAIVYLDLVAVFSVEYETAVWAGLSDYFSSLEFSPGWETLLFSMFLFAAIFISSVPVAVSQDPPLPRVRIIGVEKPTVGALIDRSSGGVWHVLGEDGAIRVIPDGQIKAAHITRGNIHDIA